MASGSVWTARTAGHLRIVPQWEKNDWINFKKVAEKAEWERCSWIIFSRTSIIRNTFDQQTVACTKQRLVQRSVLAELQQACRGAKENLKSVVGLEGIGTC